VGDWIRVWGELDLLTKTIISGEILFAVVMLFRAVNKYRGAKKSLLNLQGEIERDHVVKSGSNKPITHNNRQVIDVDPYDYVEIKEYSDITPHFVPAILTGVGIFGTFLGISMALLGFPSNIADSKQMFAHMTRLIPSMQTAFFTSIVGIGGATFFVFLEKIFLSSIKKTREAVLAQIDKKFICETPALYLRKQLGTTERMATAINELKDAILTAHSANSPEMISERVRAGLDESIQRHLKEPMTDMAAHLATLSEVRDASNKMSESNDLLAKHIVGLNGTIEGSLRDPMANIAERLLVLNDVRDACTGMMKSNEMLSQFMTGDFQGVFSGLRDSLDSARQAMTETNAALQSTNANIDKQRVNLDSFITQMEQVLAGQRQAFEEASTEIRQGFASASSQVFEQYANFNSDMTAMAAQVKELSLEFTKVIGEGRDAFQKEAAGFQVMLEEQRAMTGDAFSEIRGLNKDSIQGIVQTTKDVLTDAVEQARDSAVSLIEQTKESFTLVVGETNAKLQGTLEGVGSELVRTSERVQGELERFREGYTQALSGFFEQQRGVLEKVMGENVSALSALVEDLRRAFDEEYKKKKELIDRLQVVIASGASLTEMQKESIRDLADETVQSNRKLSSALAGAERGLLGINSSLESIASAVSKEVAEQIEAFGKKQREVVTNYQVAVDSHMKDVLEQVVAATETLAAASLVKRESA
jgi:hypothetical protein